MKYYLLLLTLFAQHVTLFAQTEPTKPNIIFIVLDDMNDYVSGFNGHPQAKTPNIQKIGKFGTTFTNAFCNSTTCTPTRFSFISGKDVNYTQVFNNNVVKCQNFRSNFTAAKNNETVYTIPEVLKDSGGYYTLNISKIMACHEEYPDFDTLTAEPCDKGLSWSDYKLIYGGSEMFDVQLYGLSVADGIADFNFAPIPDSLESQTLDYLATDTAIAFLNDYASNPENYCNKPFFLAVGYRRPHQKNFIPEKYWLSYYNDDIKVDPFDIPYNTNPAGSPYNGVVMPPQPTPPYSDFYYLEDSGYTVPVALIKNQFVEEKFSQEIDHYYDFGTFPIISPALSDSERMVIVNQSIRANAVMSYLAAGRYVDAQIGRLFTALKTKPEIFNNTILVFTSDHGYSLGEKEHWEKATLYETDVRVPLIICDLRNPVKNSTKRPVSLIDIFPTLLDMADVNEPLMPDGSPYLDGVSIAPLMANPNLAWDRPVLTTYKNKRKEEGECYPQFSVRTEEWHYMKYTTNGSVLPEHCNPDSSIVQEELYHIGSKRQFDPNEWNNLANDPAYATLINYLDNFLPDSSNYLDFAREPITDYYSEPPAQENIFVYPNPANEYFAVQLPDITGDHTIRIVNAFGIEVYAGEITDAENNSDFYYGTQQLPSGNYFVIVQNDQFTDTKQLMIIH